MRALRSFIGIKRVAPITHLYWGFIFQGHTAPLTVKTIKVDVNEVAVRAYYLFQISPPFCLLSIVALQGLKADVGSVGPYSDWLRYYLGSFGVSGNTSFTSLKTTL